MENYSQSFKRRLGETIDACIDEKVFPGAAIGIVLSQRGKFQRTTFCYGKTEDSGKLVDTQTFYDLASLTKPLVTVFSILALIEEKKIAWNEKLGSLLSENIPYDKRDITLIHLLSHSSGLPAHRKYFLSPPTIPPEARKKEIIDRILHEDLEYKTGEKNIYSDLGYILLGIIVERKSGMDLDEFWEIKIRNPLALQHKLFFPKTGQYPALCFAVTGYNLEKKNNLAGVVHDDNCRFMGGVAGHAGLFGTVEGVSALCEYILKGYDNSLKHPLFNNEHLRKVLQKQLHTTWTLGFDTPSPGFSSSGRYFSASSVGHLGFTGTSFWIDLERRIAVVFLTNRTFYGVENEKIRKVRPAVHDMIMEEILTTYNLK
jgi:CubicO group peptidase (beta-lactamase class C family)